MGYVTVTESVGEVMKTYHFSSYDDFKDWENKITGVVVSEDEEGWIENTGKRPDLNDGTFVEVKFQNGETAASNVEDWDWSYKGIKYGITHYRAVGK